MHIYPTKWSEKGRAFNKLYFAERKSDRACLSFMMQKKDQIVFYDAEERSYYWQKYSLLQSVISFQLHLWFCDIAILVKSISSSRNFCFLTMAVKLIIPKGQEICYDSFSFCIWTQRMPCFNLLVEEQLFAISHLNECDCSFLQELDSFMI